MAMRSTPLGTFSSRLVHTVNTSRQCLRQFHKPARPAASVPSPTPFVPDVQTFLTLIGRSMSKHASKLPSWEKLFTLNSNELRAAGIEPARQRRYLMRKREKFRKGLHGPGGDLEHVVDGVAQLRVVEVPDVSAKPDNPKAYLSASATLSPDMRRAVVNLPPDATKYEHNPDSPPKKFAHIKIHRGSMIKGPFLQPVRGSNGSVATIKVQEGMWEDKRGHKVDGGERRRVEIQAKRRVEERRKGIA
ncbi:hypothetical protein N7474_003862 [Penicillium riverlandense]|uniref:uncharacterized protein n=1 Tax=Penicillium riverlandense TaxID=1903569 RepID=UPI0025499ECC|nr:uncharacterized protein N7474_003862 [Penicillium riverlandense]KAJ5818271.1 hypothetical protein N7474_003862 [Penicillium riverlandense]